MKHEASAESPGDHDLGLVRAFRIGLVASVLLLASNLLSHSLLLAAHLALDARLLARCSLLRSRSFSHE